jgi:hypothetical protein
MRTIVLPSSVIIRDLDLLGAIGSPDETEAKLLVDPDAVLALAISLQGLQGVPRRNA